MVSVRTYRVRTSLPERIEPLRRLAHNLWWTWNADAVELFRSIDPDAWERHRSNPVAVLGHVSQRDLVELAKDEAFLDHMDTVTQDLDEYMADRGWFGRVHPTSGLRVGYFSLEFGLNECLSVYSGGLGILAGDHLKSASDLGIPLVAVGLAYGQAWRQYLNADGWQQDAFPANDFFNLPATLVRDAAGAELRVNVELPDGPVFARAWKVQVGRVPLYLLDTAIEPNRREDWAITAQIYGGDLEMRIRQEIVLGIGGLRILHALGVRPNVCHMNEGHSAFLSLERARVARTEHGIGFEEAREGCSVGNVFTTHTPVPAGNDEFPCDLVARFLAPFRERAGIGEAELLALGQVEPGKSPMFSMPVLAIKTSERYNGVSQLHGHVSRAMWKALWPDLPRDEVPITSITNGVHASSWIGPEMSSLYRRHLGPRWRFEPSDAIAWDRIVEVPEGELWRAHGKQREHLVSFARAHMANTLRARHAPPLDIDLAEAALDPDALTIGFARRFATYKRAHLLFSDLDRLARICTDAHRPVQILLAGKAHPRDDGGKRILSQIVHATRSSALKGRVVYLEDYDIRVARMLVSGVDVWLNTPRRPLEASGTSGMKAAANGALNVSVLDGWWCEAFTPETGWGIGRGEELADTILQDQVEARALYDVLENEVVPLFYHRDRHGLPRGWISMMKRAIAQIAPFFNTHRMVREYTERFYLPASERAELLGSNGMENARALSAWKNRIRAAWPHVRVLDTREMGPLDLEVGQSLPIEVDVDLGILEPSEVAVQAIHGKLGSGGHLESRNLLVLDHHQSLGDRHHRFVGALPGSRSGEHGYTIRLLPTHPLLGDRIYPPNLSISQHF
ncbi:MAG: alpha-glucan family phosphorylase [Deltaproteobacteria bacterium]|nr:alpha-glucan family phosphorylase [Deltaproteobacteria bacterium]